MSCFDFLADEESVRLASHWQEQAALARRGAYNPEQLTELRSKFLKEYALDKANERVQGEHKVLACRSLAPGLDTSTRPAEEALTAFPRYSARLLLHFKLLAPLLTKDDDPFYLFENPVRKDHILGLPYLSAAGLKGLAADAYQHAFCEPEQWKALGEKDPERTHAFRLGDGYALRLFGLADDGVERDDNSGKSQAGRLHFSPVWFQKIQWLVMNPADKKTAIGTQPIQFEAVAPDQDGILELVYFNPHGTKDSDEATVRADLTRLLAALAAWWPALGLGAKRLAGYGAIEPLSVELQALGWTGLEATRAKTAEVAAEPEIKPPPYYADYADESGVPIGAEVLESRVRAAIADLEQEVKALDESWRRQQGKEQKKARKKLDKARNKRRGREENMRNEHRKVVAHYEKHGPVVPQSEARKTVVSETVVPPVPLGVKSLEGRNSWRQMAEWIAGEGQ